MVEVFNLSTTEIKVFSCSPREAVMCAFAQSKRNFSPWTYEERYGNLVKRIERDDRITWSCGDFATVEGAIND